MSKLPILVSLLFLLSSFGGINQRSSADPNFKTNIGWVNNALRGAEFAFDNLRYPTGNYFQDTKNVLATSCWDNFSQFGALIAFGTQQILQFHNIDLGMAALQVAADILDWQLQYFWNPEPPGGFYAFSYTDGSHLDTSVQYSDDNCFAGVVLYESYLLLISLNDTHSPLAGDPFVISLMQTTIQQSELCARWAINSQAWAGIFGGGFWWNVSTTSPGYNQDSFRPDNALFLCANLFVELFDDNANPLYLAWAQKSLNWGYKVLYNSQSNLFSWYSDLNNTINTAVFVYANALGAYAFHRYGVVTQDPSAQAFALNLSNSIYETFWSAEANAFFESSVAPWAVSTTLSGWASKSLYQIALYHQSPALLEACCHNVEFVQRHLRDSFSGAYYDSATLNGDVPPSILDYFSTLNVAWGQWLAVTLSPFCH